MNSESNVYPDVSDNEAWDALREIFPGDELEEATHFTIRKVMLHLFKHLIHQQKEIRSLKQQLDTMVTITDPTGLPRMAPSSPTSITRPYVTKGAPLPTPPPGYIMDYDVASMKYLIRPDPKYHAKYMEEKDRIKKDAGKAIKSETEASLYNRLFKKK